MSDLIGMAVGGMIVFLVSFMVSYLTSRHYRRKEQESE